MTILRLPTYRLPSVGSGGHTEGGGQIAKYVGQVPVYWMKVHPLRLECLWRGLNLGVDGSGRAGGFGCCISYFPPPYWLNRVTLTG